MRILKALALLLLPLGALAQGFPAKLPAGVETSAGGAVVGATDTQTLTNKTISGTFNFSPSVVIGNGIWAFSFLPQVSGGTVLGYGGAGTGTLLPLAQIPAGTLPTAVGDCTFTPSLSSVTIVCTQAAGNFNVLGLFTTPNPATAPEFDEAALGNGGVTGHLGSLVTGSPAPPANVYSGVAQSSTSGSGTGAVATLISNGTIFTNITITTPGSGFALLDTITFTAGGTTGTGTVLTLNNALNRWIAQNAGTNLGAWVCYASTNLGGTSRLFTCAATTDLYGTEHNWLQVIGGSIAQSIGEIDFGNAGDNANYKFLGTGTVASGGALTAVTGVSGATVSASQNFIHASTILCQSYVATTSLSVTTEMNLGYCAVPAGLMTANSILRITAMFSHSATAVTKTYTMRFGSGLPTVGSAWTGGTIIMNQNATNSDASAQTTVYLVNANSTNAQKAYPGGFTPFSAGSASAVFSPTQNTNNAQYIAFDVTDASSNCPTPCSEFGGLGWYSVELMTP